MTAEEIDALSKEELVSRFDSVLRQMREYADILDVLPDIIYKIDPDGHFVYLSKSIMVLGYSQDELLGKHFSVLVHPEDLPFVSRKAVLPRLKGKATGPENAPKLFDERRTGSRVTRNLVVRLLPRSPLLSSDIIELGAIPGEVSATGQYRGNNEFGHSAIDRGMFYGEIHTFGKYTATIDDPEKKFIGTVGVIRDISERKKLEQKKTELEQQLFHAKKMQAIGEMAGGIAHDFNNLLGVISGYTEMIGRKFGTVDEKIKKYSQIILAAIGQAADLTGKLLAFARKGKYTNIPLDMHALVLDAVQLLQHSIDRKIEIACDFRAQQSCVSGDPNQLKNACINIAINARDAMPDGGKLLFSTRNISLVDHDGTLGRKSVAEGDYLILSIRDTGIGIDDAIKERLFEPFFTTKGIGKGTGLGLACVYGIVELHKGLIDVESAKGAGTAFHVYLPTIGTIPSSVAAETIPKLTVEGHGHLLLVDDEKMFLEVNAEMLTDAGYTVESFQDGWEAIRYYRDHYREIDLVIVDMIMPRINGRECFNEMKRINPAISTVISTGYSLENDAELLAQEGVVGFLQKPFDSEKLFAVIERALENR
jgi:PAS domain S-box-containing protein